MSLRSLFSLFSSDLAIDLGTANTCVYARGKGIVVNEPSIVAINKVNGRIEAVGRDAKDMLGRTPGNIVAIKPMKDGVIADFEVTEKMLTYFIKKAHNRNVWVRPRIVIGVPSEITQVEKRAVKDSAYRAKASEVHLVEEAMAAAIGAGMPITEPSGNMIVDVGGGTTDIAVISLAGIVYSKAVRVAGNEMDEAIIQYIKKTYNLLIGERTAEAIKMEIGSAYPLEERMTMEIKGRHLIEGVPKTITITDEEVREALAETVNVIVDAVRVALERTPPELSADIVDRGIVLTGGGSLLKNLDKRLREETGLPLAMAEDPLSSVVLGAGKMLSDFNLLRKISIDSSSSAAELPANREQNSAANGADWDMLDIRQRTGYLFLAVTVGHVILISAQVQSKSGVRVLESVTLGAFASVQQSTASVVHGVRNGWGNYVDLRGVRSENETLRKQVAELEVRLQEQRALAARTTKLQELLNLRGTVSTPTLPAEVIAGNPNPGMQSVTIDRGSADGVQENMAVIAPTGIVGRVVGSPAAHAARVQLIIDRHAAAGSVERAHESRRHGGRPGRAWESASAHGAGVEPRRSEGGRHDCDLRCGRHLPEGLCDRARGIRREGTRACISTSRSGPLVEFRSLEEVLVVLVPARSAVSAAESDAGSTR